ncbi:MAG: beta-phosphoglucomutase [Candidatus Brocadiaceae bacterium]|jgi:alpha,alpha-trehalose phosphorylase
MRRQIKAVLFDLDGVIVFTDRYHCRAWKRLCEEEGWEFDEELNHRLRGIPRMASLQVILDHNAVALSDEEKRACAERKNGYYRAMLGQMGCSDLYPGAVEFLDRLEAEGVKLGLCSSSKNAMTVLEALDLTGHFDAIVTGNDITRAKPDPQIFDTASERLRVPPFHCLVFEDAASGVEAALSAGMKCIGVGSRDVLPDAPECITGYDEIDIDALLDAARTRNPPAEPWTLAETTPEPERAAYWATVFALSNGYLGVRGVCPEEDEGAGDGGYPATFVNGIYDYEPYQFVVRFPGYPERRHAIVNLCDWRIINLQVDGEPFSMSRGEVSQYRRELDMRRGVLRRDLVWTSPAGQRVRISTTRLVSMTRKHSAAIRYAVSPLDEDAQLVFESKFRGKIPSNMLPGDRTELVERGAEGQADYFLYRTRSAPFYVAIALAHSLHDAHRQSRGFDPDTGDVLVDRREANVRAGEAALLEKHVCFQTTLETGRQQLIPQALAGVREAREAGFGELLAEQERWWARHWETGDVRIDGNPADQQAIRFALFHLRQSNPEFENRSISANGLTGDAYSGHVFWDTEMYISPYFLYTDPAAVRPLLLYRHGILERARERARQMDGVGALYSWNSISGEECGVVYEAATAEYHLVSDIALAVARYVDATGDREFLRDFGAEIVFETARFLADRGSFVPLRGGQFCINAVCGPDEYACGVNNNCYTNVLARWHLRHAARVSDEMQREEPGRFKELAERIGLETAEVALWRRAADRMYVPFNEELGIHEQDDSFLYLDPADMEMTPRNTDIRWGMHPLNLWRMQVIKQADVVLLMFVRGEEFGEDVKRANYEFYEPLTCHGSSLSASIHSIIASEVGKHGDAYDYFRQSLRLDLDDFKGNTGGGLHMACMGGTWMAVVNGFAGMRDYEDGLRFDPWLPERWDGYGFKVLYRGRRLKVDVGADEVTYTLISGAPLTFTSSGETVELSPSRPSVTCGTRDGRG